MTDTKKKNHKRLRPGRRVGKSGHTLVFTLRLRAFAREFLVDRNAAQAAIRCGYAASSAAVRGTHLLREPVVQEEIAKREAKIAAKFEVTAERVIAEFARVGFADIRDIFGADGQLKAPHELAEDAARAIAGIEVTKRRVPDPDGEGRNPMMTVDVVKVRLVDKIGALNALAKHTGVLKEPAAAPGSVSWQLDPEKLAKMTDVQIKAAIASAKLLTGGA